VVAQFVGASLRGRPAFSRRGQIRAPTEGRPYKLGHYHLPKSNQWICGLWRRVRDPRSWLGRWRQLRDLPRIGVAKPLAE